MILLQAPFQDSAPHRRKAKLKRVNDAEGGCSRDELDELEDARDAEYAEDLDDADDAPVA
jgi:hypothetical protein